MFYTLHFLLPLFLSLFYSPHLPVLFFSARFSQQIKLNRGSDTEDKELVKSSISIRMAAYSCSEPTLVNVRAEGLRAGQEAQLSWVKCAWLYRLHLLCWDGVCGPFFWCHQPMHYSYSEILQMDTWS